MHLFINSSPWLNLNYRAQLLAASTGYTVYCISLLLSGLRSKSLYCLIILTLAEILINFMGTIDFVALVRLAHHVFSLNRRSQVHIKKIDELRLGAFWLIACRATLYIYNIYPPNFVANFLSSMDSVTSLPRAQGALGDSESWEATTRVKKQGWAHDNHSI